jgi:AAA domain
MDRAPRGPASVILMSAEDDPSRIIVPRLKAAGADLTRIHILESIILPGNAKQDSEREPSRIERPPSILAHDIEAIEEAAAGIGDCRLIVIDPVTAYLCGIDDHRNTELRGVLWPLKTMAERLNAAVILVTHMSKGGATQAKHRVIGSIAYVGACRANFLFVKDRDDPSRSRVLMCDNGSNLAPEVPTLSYIVEDRGDGPVVAWGTEPVPITADEALQAQSRDEDQQADRRACDQWLRETLANGPVLVEEVWRRGKEERFSRDALKRAKARIGATTVREGFQSKCSWCLGNASDADASTHIGRT